MHMIWFAFDFIFGMWYDMKLLDLQPSFAWLKFPSDKLPTLSPMHLQWKYTLIINILVLVVLVTFYVIDDFRIRRYLEILHVQDFERGAIFRNVSGTIRNRVEQEIRWMQDFDRATIEASLRKLLEENSLDMKDVLDINVTFGINASIQASLKQGKDVGHYINFTETDRQEILQKRVQVYNTVELDDGKYASEMILPYYVDFIGEALNKNKISGLIQVLFATPDINKYIQMLRLIHCIVMVIVIVLLGFVIGITTNRLIMKPLRNMMTIIEHAEADDFLETEIPEASGTIGKIANNLVLTLTELKLAHAKRFEALSQFAGGVAHEIRNPLNSIGMTAQYLKNIFTQKKVSQRDINEAIELLDIMNYETDQLKKISEQFLTLNRPRQLKLEVVSLNNLLDFVLAEFKVITERTGIKTLRNYDPELPKTRLDDDQIRQLFFNLIQNAIQAIQPKNGSIYITTSIEKNAGGNWVIADIRDTGVGIPDQIQERIFDAYFTTKEQEGGIGLGLAIAYQIIMAHGGRIEVKSQVGMGTEFKAFFKY